MSYCVPILLTFSPLIVRILSIFFICHCICLHWRCIYIFPIPKILWENWGVFCCYWALCLLSISWKSVQAKGTCLACGHSGFDPWHPMNFQVQFLSWKQEYHLETTGCVSKRENKKGVLALYFLIRDRECEYQGYMWYCSGIT